MIGLTRCSKKHLYSITSLARRSNRVGTARPSALAVFMFVDHELEFGRLLYRQIGRLGAFEDDLEVSEFGLRDA